MPLSSYVYLFFSHAVYRVPHLLIVICPPFLIAATNCVLRIDFYSVTSVF